MHMGFVKRPLSRVKVCLPLKRLSACVFISVAAFVTIASTAVAEDAPFIPLRNVITVKLLADGKTIACGRLRDEPNRTVVLIDVLSQKETAAWDADGPVSRLSSLDNGQVETQVGDRFQFWNPAKTAKPREWQMAGTPGVLSMAVAPSGDYLAAETLLRQKVIEVYNLHTNLPVARIPVNYVDRLQFSRDSQLLLAVDENRHACAWEAKRFERVFSQYSENGLIAFQASPDSRFLYTVISEAVTRTTVSTGESRTLARLPKGISSPCVSDDGRFVYYSFNKGRDYIFDTQLETTVREFRVPENYNGPLDLAIPRPSRPLYSEVTQCFIVPKTNGISLLSVQGLSPLRATCP
jgi:hypothetical protein